MEEHLAPQRGRHQSPGLERLCGSVNCPVHIRNLRPGNFRNHLFIRGIDGLKIAFPLDPLSVDVVLEFHALPQRGFDLILVLSITIWIIPSAQTKSIELCKNT